MRSLVDRIHIRASWHPVFPTHLGELAHEALSLLDCAMISSAI